MAQAVRFYWIDPTDNAIIPEVVKFSYFGHCFRGEIANRVMFDGKSTLITLIIVEVVTWRIVTSSVYGEI
jgi:hypothetical protein